MARKKQSKTSLFVIKFLVISLAVAAVTFAVGNGSVTVLRKNDYFRIRAITIDPSLQFINKNELKNLLGKNIFDIDLKGVQRRLSFNYPQASNLKVVKHFPDQLAIVAKKRTPSARVKLQDQIATLDDQAIVLSLQDDEKSLPLITGAQYAQQNLVRGLPFKGDDVRIALEIIKNFRSNKSLAAWDITSLNIESLSKIQLTLSNGLDVIVDRDGIAQRMRVLGVVLAQDQLNIKEINYIDLRFKEPIIGKKK